MSGALGVIDDATTASLLDLTAHDLRPAYWHEVSRRASAGHEDWPRQPWAFEIAVATDDGAGYVLADSGRICQLEVVPERRREGIGGALLREALRRIGSGPVAVAVHVDNEPALALYRGHGFVHVGQRGPLLEMERAGD